MPQTGCMKKWVLAGLFFFQCASFSGNVSAQCSICTKTTQQLGEKPARGMNTGILYLAFTPLLIAGYIGYRWWKSNGATGGE